MNYWLSGIGGTLDGLFLWSSILQGGLVNRWSAVLITILIADLIYIFLLKPKITFFEDGLIITNPVTQFTVGWADVEEIDTRWAFCINTMGRQINAWAAPGPGRHHARTVHATEVQGMQIAETGSIRPALSPRTDSGVATHLAQLRLDEFRRRREEGVDSSLTFKISRDWRAPVLGAASFFAIIILNNAAH